MFSIFVMDIARKGAFFQSRSEKLNPTSCRAVLVKLDRRIPANWSSNCKGNNLHININSPIDKDTKNLRAALYRELANNFISIAKNSPSDNLERTDFVSIKLNHRKLTIDALTEGKYLIKLATMTDPKLIAQHFKVTINVKEAPKP